ncbi:hypothetical protein EDD17DRAFT_1628964 [Pisolithus thermaeus]|nr:hypothetical protein EDD17DRAFT_1628964 [Pisolithus thermaeus]
MSHGLDGIAAVTSLRASLAVCTANRLGEHVFAWLDPNHMTIRDSVSPFKYLYSSFLNMAWGCPCQELNLKCT